MSLITSLVQFTDNFRTDFSKVEERAKELSNLSSLFTEEKRTRKRKLFFDESRENEHQFTDRYDFIVNTFYAICDNTKAQLTQRTEKYESVLEPFRVFYDSNMTAENRFKLIKALSEIYKYDIEVHGLQEEFEQFILFLITTIFKNEDFQIIDSDNNNEGNNNIKVDIQALYKVAKDTVSDRMIGP